MEFMRNWELTSFITIRKGNCIKKNRVFPTVYFYFYFYLSRTINMCTENKVLKNFSCLEYTDITTIKSFTY